MVSGRWVRSGLVSCQAMGVWMHWVMGWKTFWMGCVECHIVSRRCLWLCMGVVQAEGWISKN